MNTDVSYAINPLANTIVIAGSGGAGGGWTDGGERNARNICYGGGGGAGSLWDISTGSFENKGQDGGDSGGDGADAETTKTQKETMFIQILEGLHADEAQVLIGMKNKSLNKMYKGLTSAMVREAFNWNDKFMQNENN